MNVKDLVGEALASKLHIGRDDRVKSQIKQLTIDDRKGSMLAPFFVPQEDSLKAKYESVMRSKLGCGFLPPSLLKDNI